MWLVLDKVFAVCDGLLSSPTRSEMRQNILEGRVDKGFEPRFGSESSTCVFQSPSYYQVANLVV